MNFFKTISGKSPKIIFGDYAYDDVVSDNTKARNEMRFIPKFEIHKGIEKVFSDITQYYKTK